MNNEEIKASDLVQKHVEKRFKWFGSIKKCWKKKSGMLCVEDV